MKQLFIVGLLFFLFQGCDENGYLSLGPDSRDCSLEENNDVCNYIGCGGERFAGRNSCEENCSDCCSDREVLENTSFFDSSNYDSTETYYDHIGTIITVCE